MYYSSTSNDRTLIKTHESHFNFTTFGDEGEYGFAVSLTGDFSCKFASSGMSLSQAVDMAYVTVKFNKDNINCFTAIGKDGIYIKNKTNGLLVGNEGIILKFGDYGIKINSSGITYATNLTNYSGTNADLNNANWKSLI